MADSMRTKAYPPLPPKGTGPRIAIVLPTTGDLQLRSLLPDVFQQQLVIHADPAYVPYYQRFVVLRKFIVMSSDGDLYTQSVRTTLELKDLPRQQLLPLPSISPWDILQVLDLVQCFSGPVSWELVRVRWKNHQLTWLPIELLQRNFAPLLQTFYVNSINSWAFRDRIFAQNLQNIPTEVELWLHHDEFRKFYQFLRQRRAQQTTIKQPVVQPQTIAMREEDAKVALKRSMPQQLPVRTAPVPPRGTQQQIPSHYPYQQQQQQQQHVNAALTTYDRSHQLQQIQQQQQTRQYQSLPLRSTTATAAPVAVHSRQQQQPPTRSNATTAAASRSRQVPATALSSTTTHNSRVQPTRTTALISAESALQSLSSPPPATQLLQSTAADVARSRAAAAKKAATTTARPTATARASALSRPNDATTTTISNASSSPPVVSKTFKRLKKQRVIDTESEDDDVVPLIPTPSTSHATIRTPTTGSMGISPVAIIDDDDEAATDAATRQQLPLVLGDIRCVCGATTVGAYAGDWLHCCHDDCSKWEHADCVGFVGRTAIGGRYECAQCDAAACRIRRTAAAATQLVDWLFQCCTHRNTALLLQLLRDYPHPERARGGWVMPQAPHTTLLMHAAHWGLTKAVQFLVHVSKVDVFATDDASLNVLHYAVLGGKRRCVQYLLSQEPKLLEHQDRTGRTPFHCLLTSQALNDLSLELLVHDPTLSAKSDLKANAPLHFACQALTRATPEIIGILLQHEPQTIHDASSDGLTPLLLLCRAAASTDVNALNTTTRITAIVKDVVRLFLDIDVLGSFYDARSRSNGWTCVHFAAASGNHELVAFVCQQAPSVDIHATTTDTHATALHVAAARGFALCVRALLRFGLHETAKDAQGWIPLLYAETAAVVQEFLPYKLTKQLSRLHRMTTKFQTRDVVRQWQRRVMTDPDCFDMLNDWCACDRRTRIPRMRGLFLTTPFLLRLDNKLAHLRGVAFPALRALPSDELATDKSPRPCVQFVLTSSNGSLWSQFVAMAKQLEPESFRAPMQFSLGATVSRSTHADTAAVLTRLVADLAAIEPGVVRADAAPSERSAHTQALDFYLFGELVAHLVLHDVSLRNVVDLSTPFLRCALRATNDATGDALNDARWLLPAQSFAGGFEHVAPSTLVLLDVASFRVLVNGRANMLDARGIDWERAIEWSALGDRKRDAATWWRRFVHELVVEEQQLVVLALTETFGAARQKLWAAASGELRVLQRLVRVERVTAALESDDTRAFAVDNDAGDNDDSNQDALMPHVDWRAHTISLPTYSSYDAFKRAMLRWLRHWDAAFRQR